MPESILITLFKSKCSYIASNILLNSVVEAWISSNSNTFSTNAFKKYYLGIILPVFENLKSYVTK